MTSLRFSCTVLPSTDFLCMEEERVQCFIPGKDVPHIVSSCDFLEELF